MHARESVKVVGITIVAMLLIPAAFASDNFFWYVGLGDGTRFQTSSPCLVENMLFMHGGSAYLGSGMWPGIKVLSSDWCTTTFVNVVGFSRSDPYDRIVSLVYSGFEVARFITPDRQQYVNGNNVCVPQNGLCNWFNWTVSLPFSANSNELTVSLMATPWLSSSWNFNHTSIQSYGNQEVFSVIPMQRIATGQTINFTLFRAANVFFILSAHGSCEMSTDNAVRIDSYSTHFYNWHPVKDGGGDLYQNDYVGENIPYISLVLSAGTHSLTVSHCWSYDIAGMSYVLVSAFGVVQS